MMASQFLRKRVGALDIHIVNDADVVALILEPTGHVRTHTAYTDESNSFRHF